MLANIPIMKLTTPRTMKLVERLVDIIGKLNIVSNLAIPPTPQRIAPSKPNAKIGL